MLHSAPFWRTADKLGFVIGTLILVSYSYLIGKYPHDFFYSYYAALVPVMISLRIAHYYSQGWHYYITDFCYYANCLVLYLICYESKSDQLIKICFLYCNGILAISIWLFRNSLVLHKIDMLTSLGIHVMPMFMMYHVKWFTIHD